MEIERVIKSKKYKKGRDRCGYEPIYILKDIPKLTAEKKPDRVYLDMRGYFLIKVEKGWIYAGQVNKKNEMFRIMKGKTAEDLYNEIIKRKWISRLDHAAYIGSELKKAELFLKGKIKDYVQE